MAATPSRQRPWGMVTGFEWVGSMRPSRKRSGAADAIRAGTPAGPFAPVLGRYRLARPLADQFLGADRGHRVRLDGTMHQIWHRHVWLQPLFSLLARFDILFPESGCDVPASMTIAKVDEGATWRRTFAFVKSRRFDATMRYLPQSGLVERIGPRGLIEVPWRIRVLAGDAIEITTGRLRMRAGLLRLPIPGVFQVAVRATERAVSDTIAVDLVVSHRFLGAIFGYNGTFAVRREALNAKRPNRSEGVSLQRYRPWFYAAAAYNLAWGLLVIVWPVSLFRLIGMPLTSEIASWQALGMMVLVYAPAYWWVARDPVRHRHLAAFPLPGKLLGPLGFLWALHAHRLPLQFGLTILTNDCLWWPAFTAFLVRAARHSGGWRALLAGR